MVSQGCEGRKLVSGLLGCKVLCASFFFFAIIMLLVGLTGGIGSGKSAVGALLAKASDVVVLVMDDVAKELMDSEKELRTELKHTFGNDVYTQNGEGPLDRAKLAHLIFAQPENLPKVNAIVHPRVKAFVEVEARRLAAKGVKILVVESALLFSAGLTASYNVTVLVAAPEDVRVARVMQRNNLTKEQVLQRVRQQSDWEAVSSQAHYVLDNSGTEAALPAQVEKLDRFLRQKANL